MMTTKQSILAFLALFGLAVALDAQPAPLVKLTSTNGSVTLNPPSGQGVVDLSTIPSGVSSNIYYYSLSGLVVCPYTNLPGSVSNNPSIFTPNNGANYVQQAINALPYAIGYTNFVGGGRIWVVGTNLCPTTLLFTNANGTNAAASWNLEAPSFSTGALIVTNAPTISVQCLSNNASFTLKNCIVAALNDANTNIVEIGNGANVNMGIINILDNWIGPWYAMVSNVPPLAPPSYNNSTVINPASLIGLNINVPISDLVLVDNNKFIQCACGMVWHTDHGTWSRNFFTRCGLHATNWTTNSVFNLGCNIVLSNVANNNWHGLDNHFYMGSNSYFVDYNYLGQFAYLSPQYGTEVLLENDSYEGMVGGMVTLTNCGITCSRAANSDGNTWSGGVPVSLANAYFDGSLYHSPWTISVGAAYTGQICFFSHDYNGLIVIGPTNCAFQASPVAIGRGGSYWHDESGNGVTLDGSGNVGGNGSKLTAVKSAIASNVVSGIIQTNMSFSGTKTNNNVAPTTKTWYTNAQPYTNRTSSAYWATVTFTVTNTAGNGAGVSWLQTNASDSTIITNTFGVVGITAIAQQITNTWSTIILSNDTIGTAVDGTLSIVNSSLKLLP